MSQQLTQEQLALVEEINRQNIEIGQIAVDAGLFTDTEGLPFDAPYDGRALKAYYSMRLWKQAGGRKPTGVLGLGASTPGGGFAQSARGRQDARVFESTLEGWATPYPEESMGPGEPNLPSVPRSLAVDTITEAQRVMTVHIMEAIANRALKKSMIDAGVVVEFDPKKPGPRNWKQIDHPGLRVWAPPEMAKEMNNMLSRQSALMDVPTIRWLTRKFSMVKRIILAFSFFHHQAFVRSFIYTVPTASALENMLGMFPLMASSIVSPFNPDWADRLAMKSPAYRVGAEVIAQKWDRMDALVRKGGLTVGRQQEFEEIRRNDFEDWTRRAKRAGMPQEFMDKMGGMVENGTSFLFNRLGANLKVAAAVLDVEHELQKRAKEVERGIVTIESKGKGRDALFWAERRGKKIGEYRHTHAGALEEADNEVYRIVASKANDDFGGLNLRRGIGLIGGSRNPTVQHLLRLLLLAPDWTESNFNTARKAFKGGYEGEVYRWMWMRVAARAATATALWNFVVAAAGDWDEFEEVMKKSVKAGRPTYGEGWSYLRWMEADVTRLSEMAQSYGLPVQQGSDKYFSILGHFRDPIKWALGHGAGPNIGRVISHKLSPLGRFFQESLITGTDWAERPFTTLPELLGTDDKGVYKTTRRGKYYKGMPKGGKLKGEMVAWGSEMRGGPLHPTQWPSFLLSQMKGWTPIQVQAWWDYMAGQQDAWDALSDTLGLMMARTYPERE